jgi:hypothetical protein
MRRMFLYSVASATKALATAKIDVNEQCRVRPVITIRIWPRAKKKNPLWRGGTSELQAWIHLLQTMLLQPRLGRLTKAVDHSHIVYPQGCLADSVDAPIREKSTMTGIKGSQNRTLMIIPSQTPVSHILAPSHTVKPSRGRRAISRCVQVGQEGPSVRRSIMAILPICCWQLRTS